MNIEKLEVKLTPRELAEKSEQLAESVKELEAIEAEKKWTMAQLKERVEEASEKVSNLATIVRRKAEDRPVECTEEKFTERAVVITVRTDTGEAVRSRPMTAGELADARQVHLFDASSKGTETA